MREIQVLATFLALWVLPAVAWQACSDPPRARETIGIKVDGEFSAATKSAMSIMNRWAGCTFLVPGDEVTVLSANGEPCGDAWRPESENGHSATSYRCSPTQRIWEVHIDRPGDLHTQLCIIAHELGHVAGLKDGGRGIMNQHNCPEFVTLTDAEVSHLKGEFCR